MLDSRYPLWRRVPVEAQTTIPCNACATPLKAKRTCHEVTLHCTGCGAIFDIVEYINVMDKELETFMDQMPCDRI